MCKIYLTEKCFMMNKSFVIPIKDKGNSGENHALNLIYVKTLIIFLI